ncbi:MAG TPA: TonB-dependent receptor [Bacteroidales bacterium]|nr:TonB-dependent receptor [Bacteroidales bacterium]
MKKTNVIGRSLILLYMSIFMFQSIEGQQSVSGTITDESRTALPGASVQVKNTSRGTFSDPDGKFAIAASGNDTLVFSMVGMVTQIIPVSGRAVIDVRLLTATTQLQDVVIVGYGTQRVKDLTAPITSVSGENLTKQLTSNVVQALQGQVAGVQIINSGVPGGGSTVRIRGVGSIGDYANPLFVVDGVFTDNIDFLSSGDIEDVTILKDASAAAIYGVRAANGVVLVTTKKGKSGKPVISYDGYYGMQVPVNIMPLSGRDQYVELINEANANATGFVPLDPSNYPSSTDWYSELVRHAGTTSHNLDISGSKEGTSYSFGGSYFYQQGIMNTKNDYSRFNIRGRIDQDINDNFRLGINTVLSQSKRTVPDESAFFQAFVNPPVYPVYDDNNLNAYPVKFGSPQSYGFGNQYGNPVATAFYNDNLERRNKLVFSIYGEIDIIPDRLTFRTSYNTDFEFNNTRDYTPEFNVGGSQGIRQSSLVKTYGNSSRQVIDNLLTLRKSSSGNSFTILLGQSTRIEKWGNLMGSALSVPGIDEQSKYLVTGSFQNRFASDAAATYNGLSFFTRGTYNYADKYLATVTFRADASSKYQQKWGYFPSIGLGWVLTEENFMKNRKLFTNLKLRASWGMMGNDNVPANSAVALGQTGAAASAVFGDRLVTGVGSQTVVQNFLKWEVVTEADFGVDFAFSDKFSGNLDFYHRVTDNVVFFAPIATGGGVAELLGNNGSVVNSGFELGLSWTGKISEKSGFRVGLNATTLHNSVLRLRGREYIPSGLVRGNYTTRTAVGHPIGSFYGYEIVGVYRTESEALLDPVSQTIKDKGFFKYRDQNGDNIINDIDRVYLGSAIPVIIAGIDLNLNLSRFDISLLIQGQAGNKILNAKRMNRDVFTNGNYDLDFYKNRWTPGNTSADYPSAEAYNFSFIQQANDFFVEGGGYIRIQNFQIGYTTDKIPFIPSIRIYLSAQRPFTFFTYKGFTPEVGGSPIASGIDNSVYPMQAIYSAGLKINF